MNERPWEIAARWLAKLIWLALRPVIPQTVEEWRAVLRELDRQADERNARENAALLRRLILEDKG